MGCNCKKVPLRNDNIKNERMIYTKKGVKHLINLFKDKMWNFLGKIFSILLVLIMIPILSIILIFNLIVKGKMVIKLPFFTQKMQDENGELVS